MNNTMHPHTMTVLHNGDTLIPHVEVANSFWRRLVGYMGQSAPPADQALYLNPCRSIHTCFMRFAIAVIFLDPQHRIVRIVPALRPWRIAMGPATTTSVIELPAGSPLPATLQPGDTLELQPRKFA